MIKVWTRNGLVEVDETNFSVTFAQRNELNAVVSCGYDDIHEYCEFATGKVRDLLSHPDAYVRIWLAEHGYALYVLVSDPCAAVRLNVASRGYGLEMLADDEDEIIRAKVAEFGYDPFHFLYDKSPYVKCALARTCADFNNPAVSEAHRKLYKFMLDILITDEDSTVRAAVASIGYGLDTLINDKSDSVLLEVVKHGKIRDDFATHKNYQIRTEMAKLGCGFDTLIHDSAHPVRYAVASFLVDENKCYQKFTVEEQHHYLDILMHDNNVAIRRMIEQYRQGKG